MHLTTMGPECFSDSQQMSLHDFNSFHNEFVERNLVSVNRDLIIRDLDRARILLLDGSTVSFRYPYLYYYFIARWATSVSISEASDLLDALIEHIHTEKSANILTFIAYRERQDEVINRLLPLADSLYSGLLSLSLEEHSKVAAKFHRIEDRNVLLLGPPDAVSDDHNSMRDHNDRVSSPKSGTPDRGDVIKDSLNINTSLRVIQVLGHVLKSRASAISAERKIEIAIKSIALSRRLMTMLYGFIDSAADFLLKFATDAFEKAQKTDRDHAIAIANEFMGTLVSAIAKLCVVRVSEAMSSPELRPLLDRLESTLKDRDELLIVLMARIAIDSALPEAEIEDFLYGVRDQNILTKNVLSLGVARRFYLDPPDHATRDRACERLSIDVKRVSSRTVGKSGGRTFDAGKK
jgi:hypothetical protein